MVANDTFEATPTSSQLTIPPTEPEDSDDDISDWSASSSSDDSDWTHVDSRMEEEQPLLPSAQIPAPVETIPEEIPKEIPVKPIRSAAEEKWLASIELLEMMGFGENPKFVEFLEKHNGDLSAVIEDIFMQ